MPEGEARKGSRKTRRIKAPPEEPDGKQQINLTDAYSGLMRGSKQPEYRQAYNAQAVADVDAIPEAVGTAKEAV